MHTPIKNKGFSLLELMTVVAIVGILSAIALPSYNEYVQRGKTVDAVATLANMRVQIEQYFQDTRTYVGFPACAPATAYFTFTCTNLAAGTYTLTATGRDTMSNFAFSINQNNVRTSTFDGTVGATCWLKNKGGTC